MKSNKSIGIFGGTFSPIHNAHVDIVKSALDTLLLDEVWVFPAGNPPHKNQSEQISAYLRLNMAKLAFSGIEDVYVNDYECEYSDISYTAKTILFLRDKYPEYQFYFIMGEDSMDMFFTWKDPQIIIDNVTFAIAKRSDKNSDKFNFKILEFCEKIGKTCEILSFTPNPISSTKLRDYLRNIEYDKCSDHIPASVLEYIKEHWIYEDINKYDVLSIKEFVKENQKPKRYEHCLRVADTAAALAANYLFPYEVAYVCGLLHDCAKHLNADELLTYCKENNIKITDSEKKSSFLLHGAVGADVAKKKYNIDDRMASAIASHTRGKPEMSLLDKIIFIADHIEPGRFRNEKLDPIREMAFKNPNRAVIMLAEDSIEYLKSQDKPIDEVTYETFRYYKNEVENENK